MKKILALLLVAAMCFSLAACGGDKETRNNNEPQTNDSETQQKEENSNTKTEQFNNEPQTNNSGSQHEEANSDKKQEKFNLYQEWKNVLSGYSLTFDKNGTATTEYGKEYRYIYYEELNSISIHTDDVFNYTNGWVKLNVTEENGVYKIGDECHYLVKPADFDKYHISALEKVCANITKGAPIEKIGESFAGPTGLTVTVNKVEVVDVAIGIFDLHITCENTTSEDIEFVNTCDYHLMRGSAVDPPVQGGTLILATEDKIIPANSAKEIVRTVTIHEDLIVNDYVFFLLGFPCGEADEKGHYKNNYVDVAPFFTE